MDNSIDVYRSVARKMLSNMDSNTIGIIVEYKNLPNVDVLYKNEGTTQVGLVYNEGALNEYKVLEIVHHPNKNSIKKIKRY